MGRVQAVEHVAHDPAHHRRWHALVAGIRPLDQMRERVALDVVHHQEQIPFERNHVEGGHDVRVADARREPRLVDEHRHELGVLGEMRVESLDGDGSREPDLAEHAAEVDRRHAPRRDLVVEHVAANHPPGVLRVAQRLPW